MLRRDSPGGGTLQGWCRENAASDLNISEPGTYDVWLPDLKIRAPRGTKTVSVDGHLLPWVVEFTLEDIARGNKVVAVPPGGLFRVTVLDGTHIPVPNHTLLAGAREITLQLKMDASGSQLIYGNPTQCFISIDEGFSVLIEHLDITKL